MNIIVIRDGNRDTLYHQTMDTLYHNSFDQHEFVVVADEEKKGVGWAKNHGTELVYERHEHVMFLDDDIYLLKGWDWAMTKAFEAFPELGQLGAWGHPFNRPNSRETRKGVTVHYPNAVSGNCLMMPWKVWDECGPFEAVRSGPGQSEDWALSQAVLKAGHPIAVIEPFAAIHCGLTNCLGEPATGKEAMEDQIRFLLRQNNLDGMVKIR